MSMLNWNDYRALALARSLSDDSFKVGELQAQCQERL